MNISDMLMRNALMFPDETALIETAPSTGKRKEITWKQFDDRVNQMANALQSRGIRKGDRIMQLMRNSLDWLLVYFVTNLYET